MLPSKVLFPRFLLTSPFFQRSGLGKWHQHCLRHQPPNLVIMLNSFPFFPQVMNIPSQIHIFFFLLPLPQFRIIYLLLCYFRGPLFTSFPSSVFPIQSGPLLPHSSTLGGSLRPSESSKNILLQNQGVLQLQAKSLASPSLCASQTIFHPIPCLACSCICPAALPALDNFFSVRNPTIFPGVIGMLQR